MQRKRNLFAAISAGVVVGLAVAGCSSAEPTTATSSSSGEPTEVASPAATPADPADPAAAAPSPEESAAAPAPKPSPSRDASGGVANGLEPAPEAVRETLAPASLGETAAPEQGLAVEVTKWRAVDIPAGEPGEIAGPGVAFDIVIKNNTAAAIDVSNVIADLRYGADETPATTTSRPPTVPFKGSLAAGQSATGTYAFRLSDDQRSQVVIYVSLNGDTPLIAFRGNAR